MGIQVHIKLHSVREIAISVMILLTSVAAFGQQSIKDLNAKRKKIENNISRLNGLIADSDRSRKITVENLNLISQKLGLKNQLIEQIGSEINHLEGQIKVSSHSIDSLNVLLDAKNEQFASVIQKSFKNRNSEQHLFLFLLSSSSMSQSYSRIKFYKQIMAYQTKELEEIKTLINERYMRSMELQGNVKELRYKQNERLQEAENYRQEIRLYEKRIDDYKSRGNELRQELKQEVRKAEEIKNQIKRLIAEESKKRKADGRSSSDVKLSKNFSDNVGLLPSPVKNGLVTKKFGTSPHPVLKGVKVNNNGIDISVAKGSPVYAVFEGEVSKIFNVPLGGLAIIVRHGSYFTVYSNLKNVNVKVGQRIIKMQKIAEVEGDSGANPSLHFELWNERNPENPAKWLNEFK